MIALAAAMLAAAALPGAHAASGPDQVQADSAETPTPSSRQTAHASYELERAHIDSKKMIELMDAFSPEKLASTCPAVRAADKSSTASHPRYECFSQRAQVFFKSDELTPTGYLLLLAVGAQVISYDQDHTKQMIEAHDIEPGQLVLHKLDMIELMTEIATQAKLPNRSPASDGTGSAERLGRLSEKIHLSLEAAAHDFDQLPSGPARDTQRTRFTGLKQAYAQLKAQN